MSEVERAIAVLRQAGMNDQADKAESMLDKPAMATPNQDDYRALQGGKLTVPVLESALQNALSKGNSDDARKLQAMLNKAKKLKLEWSGGGEELEDALAGEDSADGDANAFNLEYLINRPRDVDPGILSTTAETIAALASSAFGGTAGQIGGTLEGLAKEVVSGEFGTLEAAKRIEQQAMKRAQQLSYQPEGEAAQEIVSAVGETLAPIAAVAPMAQTAVAGRLASPVISNTAQRLRSGATQIKGKAPSSKKRPDDALDPAAQARADAAKELDIPITLGQKTRDPDQLAFERKMAATKEGEGIAQRFDDTNISVQNSLDQIIAKSGRKAEDPISAGVSIDAALAARINKDKKKINSLYDKAKKKGEMEAPVTLEALAKHLNENKPEASISPILSVAGEKAKQLGAVSEVDGVFIAKPVSLNNAERLRRSIGDSIDNSPTNARQGVMMKNIIDDSTTGAGGESYKMARSARRQFQDDYKNYALVKNLTETKKGTSERVIAIENTVKTIVESATATRDSVAQIKKLLQTGGKQGNQAWADLKGSVLQYIKEKSLKVDTDGSGNNIFNSKQFDKIVKKLDREGKLNLIFGKKQAKKVRVINDLVNDIMTVPKNTFGSTSPSIISSAMFDVVLSGVSGVPAPVASVLKLLGKGKKEREIKARIQKSLSD